jgi:uncharacterized cupredoxin-like copper-binding protein
MLRLPLNPIKEDAGIFGKNSNTYPACDALKRREPMKTRGLTALLIVAVLAATMLTACGGPTKIDVSLKTYTITPSATTAKAGEITFHITNDATDQAHEFVVFKSDLPEDQLPLNAEGVVDEEAPGLTLIDEAEDIEPGVSKDLTVTLEPGNYILVCNTALNQHYTHGMHITFVVK